MSGQPIFNEDDNCFANTEVIMVILVILVILVELWRWERESGKSIKFRKYKPIDKGRVQKP